MTIIPLVRIYFIKAVLRVGELGELAARTVKFLNPLSSQALKLFSARVNQNYNISTEMEIFLRVEIFAITSSTCLIFQFTVVVKTYFQRIVDTKQGHTFITVIRF